MHLPSLFVDCAYSDDNTAVVSVTADGYMSLWTSGPRSSPMGGQAFSAKVADKSAQEVQKFKRNWRDTISHARQTWMLQQGGEARSPTSGTFRTRPGLLRG